MNLAIDLSWAVASPPFFKVAFLTIIALVIPGFFVVMWIMSRAHKKKGRETDKKQR